MFLESKTGIYSKFVDVAWEDLGHLGIACLRSCQSDMVILWNPVYPNTRRLTIVVHVETVVVVVVVVVWTLVTGVLIGITHVATTSGTRLRA